MKRIVVAGTGTAIGKTFVSCALLRLARGRCRPCVGLKPIESGADAATSDAAQLSQVSGLSNAALYALRAPLSPHLAAELDGVMIDLDAARTWVLDREAHAWGQNPAPPDALSVVELAGGLFTPLTLVETNLDLIAALDPCRFVLVAPDRLGVLHDLGATIRAARSAHRPPEWIVLNPMRPDAATVHNRRDVQRLFPEIPVVEFDADDSECLLPILS